ncbi:MAG: hypothetical protein E7610_10045 [Ruminococcaceae bacterium]|nr:hypothetical protein [Oscillospiraceae bacterium]
MKFREKLARFLYGRYGADSLYNALFVCELILIFTGTVLNILGQAEPALAIISMILYGIALLVLVFAMYRFFSRNIAKRRRENEVWLRFKAKFRPKKKPHLPPDTAEHIFRACPHCRSTLRLPRQKGKHEVRCPRCGEKFGVKVK